MSTAVQNTDNAYEKALSRLDQDLALLNNGESNVESALQLVDRVPRAGTTNSYVEELERNIIANLTNLFETNPDYAMRIANRFLIGAGYSDLRGKIVELEFGWRRQSYGSMHELPEVESPALQPTAEDGVFASSPSPSRPGDPRRRPEDAIKNADRIMRKLIGGEEAGG